MSNALGLIPGSVGGAIGYRRELAGQGRRVVRFGAVAVHGGHFAAAQGIVYTALTGTLLDEDAQRVNAVKNVLVALVNIVAVGAVSIGHLLLS
ncbi:hypothetical protein SAMN05660976_00731 [Nonomuraea pusilla]|uniref:Uncharacterized protein n=1 Tax=Nonomuraea pusilla TaxID=46177 RepID=A0A1H7I9D4_9ACTN|nr:hypothetical protein SAMN05660976_00731 [Nonomuraea pusilla]